MLIITPFTNDFSEIHCSISYLGLLYKNDHKPCGLNLSLTYLEAAAPRLTVLPEFIPSGDGSLLSQPSSLQQLNSLVAWYLDRSLQSVCVCVGLSPLSSCTDNAFGFRDPLIQGNFIWDSWLYL